MIEKQAGKQLEMLNEIFMGLTNGKAGAKQDTINSWAIREEIGTRDINLVSLV